MKILGFIFFGMAYMFSGCVPSEPVPISFGEDQCYYCRMTITQPQFGAEMISDRGRVYKYDALECMINQLSEDSLIDGSYFAVPYDQPRILQPVDSLRFIISKEYRSPMGANLAAFYGREDLSNEGQDNMLTWSEVRDKLAK